MYRLGILALFCAALTACGGAGGSATSSAPNPGGGAVVPPVVVGVNAGQMASGIDISVPAPAASPAPNAQVLGVAALSGKAQAFNTGATISRGVTRRVLLFGPGLSGSMQVTISGPSDITIANIETIKATDGTPGVAFAATTTGSTALGCRTVVLQTPGGDITTFTGGLEVVP